MWEDVRLIESTHLGRGGDWGVWAQGRVILPREPVRGPISSLLDQDVRSASTSFIRIVLVIQDY